MMVRRLQCSVVGCRVSLPSDSARNVCDAHLHEPDVCNCPDCTRARARPKPRKPSTVRVQTPSMHTVKGGREIDVTLPGPDWRAER